MEQTWIAGWITLAVIVALAAWMPCLQPVCGWIRRLNDAGDQRMKALTWAVDGKRSDGSVQQAVPRELLRDLLCPPVSDATLGAQATRPGGL